MVDHDSKYMKLLLIILHDLICNWVILKDCPPVPSLFNDRVIPTGGSGVHFRFRKLHFYLELGVSSYYALLKKEMSVKYKGIEKMLHWLFSVKLSTFNAAFSLKQWWLMPVKKPKDQSKFTPSSLFKSFPIS